MRSVLLAAAFVVAGLGAARAADHPYVYNTLDNLAAVKRDHRAPQVVSNGPSALPPSDNAAVVVAKPEKRASLEFNTVAATHANAEFARRPSPLGDRLTLASANRANPGDQKQKSVTRLARLGTSNLLSSCDYALAHQDADNVARRVASGIYFWGGLVSATGEPDGCAPVDIGRAVELTRRIGNPDELRQLVNVLKERAAQGDPDAVAAMATVDLTPTR